GRAWHDAVKGLLQPLIPVKRCDRILFPGLLDEHRNGLLPGCGVPFAVLRSLDRPSLTCDSVDHTPRVVCVLRVAVDIPVQSPAGEQSVAHADDEDLCSELRLFGPVRVLYKLSIQAEQFVKLPVVVVVGKVHVPASVKILASAVSELPGLAPTVVLLRRGKIAGFVLRGCQHVCDLLRIAHAMVQCGAHDQVDGRFAIDPESPGAAAFSIVHCCISICRTALSRSEERRVGKECRSRWAPYR